MGVSAVVVTGIQLLRNICKLCPGHSLPDFRKELLVIHGRVTIGLCQIVAFIRHDGYNNIFAAGEVFLIEMIELLHRIGDRNLIQRIFQLGSIIINEVNIVVVLLAQSIVVEDRFQLPEGIPQGELIQRVAFKLCHELAVQNRLGGQFRELGQHPPFGIREIISRAEPCSAGQNYPKECQRRQTNHSNFLHSAALLRI